MGKSKQLPLEKCTQVAVGLLVEVCDRRDFHVLSLDMRKRTLTCALLDTKIFQKAGEGEEYLSRYFCD